MGYSLYKYFETPSKILPHELAGEVACDSKTEGVLNNKSYNNDFEVQIFKPSLFNLFLKGYCKSFKDYISYLFWLVISYFELTVYYVKDGEKLIHTSLVTGKSFKFPFMSKDDLHIASCKTIEEYRDRGIYPKVLQKITSDYPKKNIYMIVKDSNIASIKGVTKARFSKIGKICKYKKLFTYRYALGLGDWKYYNHAVIPNTAPHITPDLTPIKDGSIWNIDGKFPLFARWTSDFDCKEETDWWYTIKDSAYNLSKVPSKKKYNINKSRRNFEIKIINPRLFSEQIADICGDAFLDYLSIYSINYSKNKTIESIKEGDWDKYIVFGAFERKNNDLCGFYSIFINGKTINLKQLKVFRKYEKERINYALIDGVCSYFSEYLKNGYSISNGCRNLVHQTNYNILLYDNFGFRKAYCTLNIEYRPILRPFVFILYLFRRTINHFKNIHPLIYKINAVLEMESIARKCRAMQ